MRANEFIKESIDTDVVFEITTEDAFERVMSKFGNSIEWSGDYMVVPRKLWPSIEQLAYETGGEAVEISDEQLNELSFMGSPCTKDCSGHRAGYDWSKRKGKIHAASWSRSFNNGAAIAAAEI